MFSRWIENTVEKGENARYEQFLLLPQCFQKTCTTDTEKPGLVWERVKCLNNIMLENQKNDKNCIGMEIHVFSFNMEEFALSLSD